MLLDISKKRVFNDQVEQKNVYGTITLEIFFLLKYFSRRILLSSSCLAQLTNTHFEGKDVIIVSLKMRNGRFVDAKVQQQLQTNIKYE